MSSSISFEAKGWWHLPDHGECKVPGVLRWSNEEGGFLDLFDSIWQALEIPERSNFAPSHGPGETDVIFGQFLSGEKVTLFQANRSRHRRNIKGVAPDEQWLVDWVIVGEHIRSLSSAVLTKLYCTCDYLYEYMDDLRVFEPELAHNFRSSESLMDDVSSDPLIPYVIPVLAGKRSEVFTVERSGLTYQVDLHVSDPPLYSSGSFEDQSFTGVVSSCHTGGRFEVIAVPVVASVQGRETFSLESVPELALPFLDLVRISSFEIAYFGRFVAETTDGSSVQIYTRFKLDRKSRMRESQPLLFRRKDLSLKDFLTVRDQLLSSSQAEYAWTTSINLLTYSSRMVEESVSLTLAAAEGLHRWCYGKIGEMKLRERLIDLYAGLHEDVKELLRFDVEAWADWGVWARNHVSHGGSKKNRQVASILTYSAVADSVRLVIYLSILERFAISPNDVVEFSSNHERFRRLLSSSRRVTQKDSPEIPI